MGHDLVFIRSSEHFACETPLVQQIRTEELIVRHNDIINQKLKRAMSNGTHGHKGQDDGAHG